MADPTPDEGIAALEALSDETTAPETHEQVVDPIVQAAKVTAEPEANIEPAIPRPIQSPSRVAPTRLQSAEKALDVAKKQVEEAKRELADAARAAAGEGEPQLTLVELNALARKQQAPEAAQRRRVHELMSEVGLLRRPHQTHSAVATPLPNTEASVKE